MISAFFHDNKKIILYVFIACLVYSLPILIADRFFIDDLGRSARGYYGGASNGRPFSDLVMMLIGFGGLNIDISPIPLLLALMIYSFSSVAFVKNIKGDASGFVTFITSLGFIINPFLLENLSYKYDSLTMIISMSSIMLAFIGYRSEKIRFIIGCILVLISLSSYQASIGLFICLSIFEFVVLSYNKSTSNESLSSVYYRSISRILQLALAFLLYKALIEFLSLTQSNDYSKLHSEIIPFSLDGIIIAHRNFDLLINMIWSYFSSLPTMLSYIILFSLIISYALISFYIIKCRSISHTIATAIVIASPFLFLFFSIIHLAILKHAVVEPRVLISFSSLTMLILCLGLVHNKIKNILTLPCCIYIIFCYTYAFAYGNALKSVKDYESYVSASIANDIKLEDPYGKLKIQTTGYMDYPAQASIAISKYPSMKYLLPRYLNDNWSWAFHQLRIYNVKNNPAWLSHDKAKELKTTIVINRGDYTLETNDQYLVIALKGKY